MLSGDYINKGELQIKLPNYHADTPIKATIAGSTPYFLEQVQQANNYLALARKQTEALEAPFAKQSIIALLDDVCQFVDRAQHAFDYPNEASLFPYKVCQPKFFNPPLKQDLVIEFCLNDVYVVCNVYALDVSRHLHHKAGHDHRQM
ncbi:uncharacterized protein BYT42DRAFT_565610 [Radiomyces spectabilis]|uniref:uncharacterized protein n=1 Tax=Radiomyces spectabilis TaxID=64574 RepID=UPI002220388A|nr:uncharacterized protein BYT42DRAFT_565610 [Radiomyces spectabilis]KAI8381183.1 hypothetical protein BYT42DRAFT_565610 [Radiomyces spectabilis]